MSSCHFGHLLQVSKKSLWSLILNNFFMILYKYIAPEQGLTTPWGWNFDVNRNILSLQSFVASLKKSLWSLILYNFFMILYTYTAPGGADSPPGDKVSMSTEMSYHFIHLLQVLKKCLWSLILYKFFHDLIHVYSPGAGADSPQGKKNVGNRKDLSLYQSVASLKEIYLKFDSIYFFFII